MRIIYSLVNRFKPKHKTTKIHPLNKKGFWLKPKKAIIDLEK